MNVRSSDALARYVEQALLLIDREGGSRGLALREVSRELGFAHTNAYNYFDRLEDLLAQCLVAVLERQLAFTSAAMNSPRLSAHGRLERLVVSQLDFALEHRGWYQFVWLEPLRAEPPPRAMSVMAEAGEALAGLFEALAEGQLSKAKARLAAEDFHHWLHGALAKLLTGRAAPEPPDEVRKRLLAGTRRIVRALVPDSGR